MRAFIGIGLPEDVRASLHRLQRDLAASKADVKWVAPGNLHVTLKFLGEISEAQRKTVEALLTRIAASEPDFILGLTTLGAFPSIDSPRVIWVGLGQGTDRLAGIAQMIEREAAALPMQREERPFAAHLTLGRVRSPRNRLALSQHLRGGAWQPPAPWQVASLTLYQSVLSPQGPQYTVLADIPLTGAR